MSGQVEVSSASTRVSIQFPPAEAYEDTDTLVLSVGTHFIDIRFKAVSSHHSGAERELDWAFMGQKTQLDVQTFTWSHDLDSRGFDGIDQGYCRSLPDGDELEQGIMVNPTDPYGPPVPYKEVWRSLPVDSLTGIGAFIARNSDILVDRNDSTRAIINIAVVGQHCLILACQDIDPTHLTCQRWMRKPAAQTSSSSSQGMVIWQLIGSHGSLNILRLLPRPTDDLLHRLRTGESPGWVNLACQLQ